MNPATYARIYSGELDLEDLAAEPMGQFRKWFDEACAAELLEPNAMVLSLPMPRLELQAGRC